MGTWFGGASGFAGGLTDAIEGAAIVTVCVLGYMAIWRVVPGARSVARPWLQTWMLLLMFGGMGFVQSATEPHATRAWALLWGALFATPGAVIELVGAFRTAKRLQGTGQGAPAAPVPPLTRAGLFGFLLTAVVWLAPVVLAICAFDFGKWIGAPALVRIGVAVVLLVLCSIALFLVFAVHEARTNR